MKLWPFLVTIQMHLRRCRLEKPSKYSEPLTTGWALPLTHIEDEQAAGAEDDGSHLLPVDREPVPLCLVLDTQHQVTPNV